MSLNFLAVFWYRCFSDSKIIGDGDTTALAHFRDAGIDIEKYEDINHLKKYVMSWLKVIKDTKYKKHKSILTKTQRESITIYISIILKKHKGDKEEITKRLLNLPDHLCGNHINCDDSCSSKGLSRDEYEKIPKENRSKHFLRYDVPGLKEVLLENVIHKLLRKSSIFNVINTNPNEAKNSAIHSIAKKFTDNSQSGM